MGHWRQPCTTPIRHVQHLLHIEALESSTEQPLTCFSQVAPCCQNQEHAEAKQLHWRVHRGAGRARRPAVPLCVPPAHTLAKEARVP